MATIEELADRVERLLLRHEELQRTNALLTTQLGAVTGERDSLRSRLNAARGRIDVLLQRLPREPAVSADDAGEDGSETLRSVG
jgi:cell division protein ZapB